MSSCIVYDSIHNWKFVDEESKTSAFCISPGYLMLGRVNARLEIYCITKSQYLTLLHTKELPDIRLLEVNKLENLLTVVTHTQTDAENFTNDLFIYDIQSGECRYQKTFSEKITAVFWLAFTLYIGTASGKVYTFAVSSQTEGTEPKQILTLDSMIVQFDGSESEKIVGISTYTRAFIYSIQDETTKEVGSKLRQGHQGVAVGLGRVWSARPGSRIWEVEIATAYVAATRQYRRVISEQGCQKIQTFSKSRYQSGSRTRRRDRSLTGGANRSRTSSQVSSTSSQDASSDIQESNEDELPTSNGDIGTKVSEHGFSLLRKSHTFLISYSPDGAIYIMDIHSSKLLAWTSISARIRDLRVENDVIVVLDEDGILHHLTFGSLDVVMRAAYKIQQFDCCGELFIANRKQIRSLDKEELKEIISMKDLSGKMRESSKSIKAYKLMDAVERLCISLDGRRYENRSVSQDRHERLYLSRNSPVQDELIGAKSHSQEDLLDGGKSKRQALISGKLSLSSKELSSNGGVGCRKLSAASASSVSSREDLLLTSSNRELSASEQGLQALQLYKIKQSSRSRESRVLGEDNYTSLPGGEAEVETSDCMHKSMDALLMGLEEKARNAGLDIDQNNPQSNENPQVVPQTPCDPAEESGKDPGVNRINHQEKMADKTILISKRITQELRSAGLSSHSGHLANTAHKLINSLEMRAAYTKTFANEFVSIYQEYKTRKSEEDDSHDSLDLSMFMTQEQKKDINLALIVILSDSKLLKLFVSPISDVMDVELEFGLQNDELAVYQNLIMVFEEPAVRADIVMARTLECFSVLLDLERLLECLNVTQYYTLHYLVSVDRKRNPTLSPVMIEEVTEENIYNCSNFISTYKGFSVLNLIRYIVEIQKINFECGLHIIQSQVLTIPAACIFYTCLQYFAFLNTISSDNSRTGDLYGQIQAEWSTFLSRALSVHIPGWPREWSHVMKQNPNFFFFVKNTFKSANLHFLGKQSAIKGSHKSLELLELGPLCNLLMELDEVEPGMGQLAWTKTFSFMPGLVRCLLLNKELAMAEMPLLVELGDTELLLDTGVISEENCDLLVDHILAVYGKDECPLAWDDLSKILMKVCTPTHCVLLLTRLAVLMKPGDLPQSVYVELITAQLEEQRA